MAQPSIKQALPVDPPCIVILAPSDRAPEVETQRSILETTQEPLPPVVWLLQEGESSVDGRSLSDDERDALHPLTTDRTPFCVLVIGPDGEVVQESEAPTKASAIIDALGGWR